MRMRAFSSVLLACAALAGCGDQEIAMPRAATPAGPNHVRYLAQAPTEWRGYWRSSNTLWVYDRTAEVGIHSLSSDGNNDRYGTIKNFLGMRLTRYGVHWNKYRASAPCTNGQQYSCQLGNAVSEASQKGLELVVVIENSCEPGYPCSEANGGVMTVSRAQWNKDFAAFVSKLIRDYPSVRFWQMWNEPDGGYHGIPYFADLSEVCAGTGYINRAQQGRRYRDFLHVVYDSVEAVNANRAEKAWVLSAGITGGVPGSRDLNGSEFGTPCKQPVPGTIHMVNRPEPQFAFLRAMYENGGGQYFDFLALHAYDRYASEPGGVAGKTNTVVGILENELNDANRPIWITEFGSEATSTSDRGRALDPAWRGTVGNYWTEGTWRWLFDQGQKTYYVDAVNYQQSSGQLFKMIAYHLAAPDGNTFMGPTLTCDDSFGPELGNQNCLDPDYHSYGVGIFRTDNAGHENLLDPRPSAKFLNERRGDNQIPGDIDADGGRAAPYTISTFANIPTTQGFTYTGSDPTVLSLQSVRVKTLYPTEVSFYTPIRVTPNIRAVGWMYSVFNNMVAGYGTEARVMEQLRVEKQDAFPGLPRPCLKVHSTVVGWSNGDTFSCDGSAVGTAGRHIEAVQMTLESSSPWTICYQVHSTDPNAYGWSSWGCDGETAGTTGQALSISAVRVRIHRKPDRS